MEGKLTGECINWFRSPFLTSVFRLISWLGNGIIVPVALVIIFALYFFLIKKDKIFALVFALTPLLGQILKSLMKNYFKVPRPEALGCQVFTTYGDRFSFPSGHTIFYVTFFGLLLYYYRKSEGVEAKIIIPFSLFLIITIGLSRIYLGAHWYTDVLSGYVIGGILLTAAILVYNRLSKKKESK